MSAIKANDQYPFEFETVQVTGSISVIDPVIFVYQTGIIGKTG